MPTPPLDQQLVAAYADAFAEHPFLKQNGFAFLIDISGKLFKPKGSVSLKDIEGNIEALYCTGFRQMHLSSIHTHTPLSNNLHDSSAHMVSCQAVESVMVVSRGAGRFSAHLLAAAILQFFVAQRLFPRGITVEMDCVDDLSKKMGKGLQRLVSWPSLLWCVYKECTVGYTNKV